MDAVQPHVAGDGARLCTCLHMRLRRRRLEQLAGETAPPQGLAGRTASVLHQGPRVLDSATPFALSAYAVLFAADVVRVSLTDVIRCATRARPARTRHSSNSRLRAAILGRRRNRSMHGRNRLNAIIGTR